METYRPGYSPQELIGRLNRWKNERPLHHIRERRTRGMIVRAVQDDIQNPLDELASSYVLEQTLDARKALGNVIQNGEFRQFKKDSVTGEAFWLRLRKDDGVFIAEEVRIVEDQERIISQARIGSDGRAAFTLNFDGINFNEHRLGFDRNPRIFNDPHFPRAAVETFNLLVGSATNTIFIK